MFGSMIMGSGDQNEAFEKLLRERFFFDLTGAPFPDQIHGLMRILGEWGQKKVFYGSDYCFTPSETVAGLAETMDNGVEEMFGEKGVEEVCSGNVVRLFGGKLKFGGQ
jgi:predicted metal-dependent TIM-barrel fold hydrolase